MDLLELPASLVVELSVLARQVSSLELGYCRSSSRSGYPVDGPRIESEVLESPLKPRHRIDWIHSSEGDDVFVLFRTDPEAHSLRVAGDANVETTLTIEGSPAERPVNDHSVAV